MIRLERLERLAFFLFILPLLVAACKGKSPTSPSLSPQPVTQAATQVTERSATLNGEVDTRGEVTEVWFEWGTNQNNPEKRSETRTMVVSGSFSISISGLSCGQRYYFRVIAQSRQGLSKAGTRDLSTSGCRGEDERGDSGNGDSGGGSGGDDKGPKGGGDTGDGGPKGGGG